MRDQWSERIGHEPPGDDDALIDTFFQRSSDEDYWLIEVELRCPLIK